jgi:hypothetical protein
MGVASKLKRTVGWEPHGALVFTPENQVACVCARQGAATTLSSFCFKMSTARRSAVDSAPARQGAATTLWSF